MYKVIIVTIMCIFFGYNYWDRYINTVPTLLHNLLIINTCLAVNNHQISCLQKSVFLPTMSLSILCRRTTPVF